MAESGDTSLEHSTDLPSGRVLVVEDDERVRRTDTVLELGCDLLQGYLFARPGPPFPDVAW
jgi:EAL domain-containing protein (putative c-di-GMP-specific phosphodiesterase class I)